MVVLLPVKVSFVEMETYLVVNCVIQDVHVKTEPTVRITHGYVLGNVRLVLSLDVPLIVPMAIVVIL